MTDVRDVHGHRFKLPPHLRSRPSPARVVARSVARFGPVPTIRSARTYERIARAAGDRSAVRYWRTVARRAARYNVR